MTLTSELDDTEGVDKDEDVSQADPVEVTVMRAVEVSEKVTDFVVIVVTEARGDIESDPDLAPEPL